MKRLTLPIQNDDYINLKAGERVLISGDLYTARDAAHLKLLTMIENKQDLPIEIQNQGVYYAGPTPAKPGKVIGSCGPTTSSRMDAFAPKLLDIGLKVMIGKGPRGKNVIESMIKNKAIYLAAIGGAGALISKCITDAHVVAFDELGTEAVRRITVKDLPLIVAIDTKGNSLYKI